MPSLCSPPSSYPPSVNHVQESALFTVRQGLCMHLPDVHFFASLCTAYKVHSSLDQLALWHSLHSLQKHPWYACKTTNQQVVSISVSKSYTASQNVTDKRPLAHPLASASAAFVLQPLLWCWRHTYSPCPQAAAGAAAAGCTPTC